MGLSSSQPLSLCRESESVPFYSHTKDSCVLAERGGAEDSSGGVTYLGKPEKLSFSSVNAIHSPTAQLNIHTWRISTFPTLRFHDTTNGDANTATVCLCVFVLWGGLWRKGEGLPLERGIRHSRTHSWAVQRQQPIHAQPIRNSPSVEPGAQNSSMVDDSTAAFWSINSVSFLSKR